MGSSSLDYPANMNRFCSKTGILKVKSIFLVCSWSFSLRFEYPQASTHCRAMTLLMTGKPLFKFHTFVALPCPFLSGRFPSSFPGSYTSRPPGDERVWERAWKISSVHASRTTLHGLRSERISSTYFLHREISIRLTNLKFECQWPPNTPTPHTPPPSLPPPPPPSCKANPNPGEGRHVARNLGWSENSCRLFCLFVNYSSRSAVGDEVYYRFALFPLFSNSSSGWLHSQEWSTSNFSCSLTRNMTSQSEELGFS